MPHIIYTPAIVIPGTPFSVTRYEPEGQTLILDTGRGLYVPELANPDDAAAALAAAQDRLANPMEPPAPDDP